jgi:hypothetical protein
MDAICTIGKIITPSGVSGMLFGFEASGERRVAIQISAILEFELA